MSHSFDTIDYLQFGNTRQSLLHAVIVQHGIMEILQPFDPIITGTIPIEIDTVNSDVDICCYWGDKTSFIQRLLDFEQYEGFGFYEKEVKGHQSIIANFCCDGICFEVFGQNRPTRQQDAYRHMLIEHYILKQKDPHFRKMIIDLKNEGVKTEPAFAMLLGLKGNPFKALLDYGMDNEQEPPGK